MWRHCPHKLHFGVFLAARPTTAIHSDALTQKKVVPWVKCCWFAASDPVSVVWRSVSVWLSRLILVSYTWSSSSVISWICEIYELDSSGNLTLHKSRTKRPQQPGSSFPACDPVSHPEAWSPLLSSTSSSSLDNNIRFPHPFLYPAVFCASFCLTLMPCTLLCLPLASLF